MLATNPRAELARIDAIIRLGATVRQRTPWSFQVDSQSEPGAWHTVVFDQWGRAHCSCVANRESGKASRHISATLYWLKMNQQSAA